MMFGGKGKIQKVEAEAKQKTVLTRQPGFKLRNPNCNKCGKDDRSLRWTDNSFRWRREGVVSVG